MQTSQFAHNLYLILFLSQRPVKKKTTFYTSPILECQLVIFSGDSQYRQGRSLKCHFNIGYAYKQKTWIMYHPVEQLSTFCDKYSLTAKWTLWKKWHNKHGEREISLKTLSDLKVVWLLSQRFSIMKKLYIWSSLLYAGGKEVIC